MHPEQQDRLTALRARRDAGTLGSLLTAEPLLAEGLQGRGPYAWFGPFGMLDPERPRLRTTLPEVAELLGSPFATELQLGALDRPARQLLALCIWHGGALDRATAVRLAGPSAVPAVLDAAAARLAERLLTDPAQGWVAPRPGVLDRVSLPGLLFRDAARHTTNDVLGQLAFVVGADCGPRKHERIDAIEGVLRDQRGVLRIVERLDDRERSLLDVLVAHGEPVKVTTVGIEWFNSRWVSEEARPLHGLLARGLAGVASEEQRCWVWLDVQVALRGHLFTHWAEPVALDPVPLQGAGAGAPRALQVLDDLLRTWEREPAPALKSGGLGVTPVRAAAKVLGVPAAQAELLAELAIHLHLLEGVVVGRSGKGRSASDDVAWTTAPPVVEQFRALTPAARWSALVGTWMKCTWREPQSDAWPDMVLAGAVTLVLHALSALPTGRGVPLEQLRAHLADAHVGLLPPKVVDRIVAEVRALGLVPVAGPVGLTEAGRALLAGPESLERLLAGGAGSVIVQADHTVIAPPDLHHEVAERLAAVAELESDAGARIHRITEASLQRAFERGLTGDDVYTFLASVSSTPVPPNVERLIRDAAARFGSLRARAATTVLVADDPAVLARAAAVSAAKLQIVAPTVAVSPLPEPKVLAALRAKGLAAVGAAPGPLAAATGTRQRPYGWEPRVKLPAVPPPALASADDVALLAERLAGDEPGGRGGLRPDRPSKARRPSARAEE